MATTINAGRVRFVSRGTYNNSTQYYLFDLVDYNGSSYIAKENSLGNLPTNTQYWQLIAEKGNTGNTGQTGPVGATGNGIQSITKTATSGLVDTYTITYTNGNTTTFTITNGEDGEVTETELDVLRQNDTELKNDISKIKEEQTTQNENISTNADEITNLKNENSYLQNVVKQAFTEKTASGTELTINNTIEARMEMKLNGNTSQNGEPTPSSPVDVNVVSGSNVINIYGKNILDGATWTKNQALNESNTAFTAIGWEYSDYVDVTNANYYYPGLTGVKPRTILYDKNKNVIAVLKVSSNTVYNLSSYKAKYIRVSTTIKEQERTKVYQGKELPLDLGNIELCKIGDYQDYFYKSGSKWYVHKELDKFTILDCYSRFSNVTRYENNLNASNGIMGIRTTDISSRFYKKNNLNQNALSTMATLYSSSIWNVAENYKFQYVDGLLIHLSYKDLGLTEWTNESNAEFNNKIANYMKNNYGTEYFIWQLATPENIEITDTTLISQLEALKTAMSYTEQTNISQINNGIPFYLDVIALTK